MGNLVNTTKLYIAVNPETKITKVGISSNVRRRIKCFKGFQLLTQWECGRYSIASCLERQVTRRLKPWLVQGNEWFALPKEVSVIKTVERLMYEVLRHDEELKITYMSHYLSKIKRIDNDRRRNKATPEYILSRERFYREKLLTEWGIDVTEGGTND